MRRPSRQHGTTTRSNGICTGSSFRCTRTTFWGTSPRRCGSSPTFWTKRNKRHRERSGRWFGADRATCLFLWLGNRDWRGNTAFIEAMFWRDAAENFGAEGGTRTPTPLRVHGPEPCASANSATTARCSTLRTDGRSTLTASFSLTNAAAAVNAAATAAGLCRVARLCFRSLIQIGDTDRGYRSGIQIRDTDRGYRSGAGRTATLVAQRVRLLIKKGVYWWRKATFPK